MSFNLNWPVNLTQWQHQLWTRIVSMIVLRDCVSGQPLALMVYKDFGSKVFNVFMYHYSAMLHDGSRGIASSSQLVRPNLHYVIKCVGGRYFDIAYMAFIPIVICHCKSSKPKNYTSTLSITDFCTTEYLVA